MTPSLVAASNCSGVLPVGSLKTVKVKSLSGALKRDQGRSTSLRIEDQMLDSGFASAGGHVNRALVPGHVEGAFERENRDWGTNLNASKTSIEPQPKRTLAVLMGRQGIGTQKGKNEAASGQNITVLSSPRLGGTQPGGRQYRY